MRRLFVTAVLVGVPASAAASNGVGQRTPPVYPRAACISEVDRSVDPVFHLDIGLPREDVMLTDDEPPDSRRFQFFAVCRDELPDLLTLPNWITAAEADAALSSGSLEEAAGPEDILEQRDDWADCAFEMNAIEARIPISCESTEAGLDFDTSALPAGNYVVRGYTYEPPLNLWSQRKGVLQVRDDDTPIPAVGLTTPVLDGAQVRVGSPFAIRGCATGAAGTEVVLQWVRFSALDGVDDDADWITFATVDASDGDFVVDFVPPAEARNQAVGIRAVVDPEGAGRWVDHAEGKLIVFDDGEESDPPFGEPIEVCGFYDDDLGASTGELTSGSSGEESPSGEAADDAADSGCACAASHVASDAGRPTGWLLALGVFGLVRRRRRR
ncbi:MAG: hypothetical protein AAGA54_24900 [Myxococcota bacterium]